jgi:hypothetical protein
VAEGTGVLRMRCIGGITCVSDICAVLNGAVLAIYTEYHLNSFNLVLLG